MRESLFCACRAEIVGGGRAPANSDPARTLLMPRPPLAVALLSALLFAAGCTEPGTPAVGAAASDRPIQVLATTGMIADAARIVGGDRAAVTALMGPGVDPHLYQPTARDQSQLKAA